VSDILSAFFLTFVGLFPIVNPLESAPFFYSMTAGLSPPEREAMARRVAINGFGLLLGSMVLGPYVLEFFGIQLAVVRIAGGLVVTALGWKLLTQEEHAIHAETAEMESKRRRKIGSFYPLTMPLTVGPGSMSVAITIGSGSGSLSAAILDGSPLKGGPVPLAEIAAHATGALLGLVLIGLAIYLAYRFAATVAKKLGETGLDVLVRLSAFILICIGIEILWSGFRMLTAGTSLAPG
jgi:multiple antibiotic resistance protein